VLLLLLLISPIILVAIHQDASARSSALEEREQAMIIGDANFTAENIPLP